MLHCVCTGSDDNDTVQQFSSTTTSTSTVNCLPRWIVYPKSYTRYPFWWNRAATTQHTCLDACVSNTSCVAVEWVPMYPQCRIHHEIHGERRWHPDGLNSSDNVTLRQVGYMTQWLKCKSRGGGNVIQVWAAVPVASPDLQNGPLPLSFFKFSNTITDSSVYNNLRGPYNSTHTSDSILPPFLAFLYRSCAVFKILR